MKELTKSQGHTLLALRAAAERRDAAQAEWKRCIAQVDALLDRADAQGIPASMQARTANVSRQYLWKVRGKHHHQPGNGAGLSSTLAAVVA